MTDQCSSPGELVTSSSALGWGAVRAETYVDPAEVDAFQTRPSDDLLMVMVTKGVYDIESGKGRAQYRAGSVGITAPGNSSLLRWRSTSDERLESFHAHISGQMIAETAEALGKRGVPDLLSLDDPFVRTGLTTLNKALADGAPSLYADSIAQALAAHLLYGLRGEGTMGDRTVRKLTTYMKEHLHEEVSLDDLAAQANLSKFHLLRMFKAATGFTPHRYLVDLRMHHAAQLLRESPLSVLQVAIACGYRSPGQFAAAFRRVHGVSPLAYRGNSRR
ncbi:AraC family transcriptional regulator [Actinocrispum sp. NPDC049592]|uniref:AraC family transcriptional regulator n=1 Tax=Actinocrispum sp. NPDC049592 TaxID=3154835 RepID=UPI003426206F